MHKLKELFSIEKDNINIKLVWSLIFIAYLFNIWVRFIYIDFAQTQPNFFWNNSLMINTNDGYYWAEGARDILKGFHQENDLSPINTPASNLVAFFAKVFSFISFDNLLIYLPGFLASLVVIPLIFLGRLLGSTWLGFLSALLGGMAWSYYHRTMFGYIDTDMLIVFLPLSAIVLIMYGLKKQNWIFFATASLVEIFMTQWHGGLYNVANAIFILAFIYKLIFHRKEISSIFWLIYLIIPMLHVNIYLKFTILLFVVLTQLALYKKVMSRLEQKSNKNKIILFSFAGIFLVYMALIGFPWIVSVLKNAYFTRAGVGQVLSEKLHYYSVVKTVREAGKISYDIIVHRISGSWTGFIVGFIGYLILLIRYPVMWISLPMVALGFFTVKGGLRFTIFAVPFMAFGNAYIAYLVAKYIKNVFINDKVANISKYVISLLIMSSFIYPNYKHIKAYLVPTVFTKQEVSVLDKLKSITKRDDYVVSWWDYGYPIRYYADVKTLVDGGKHSGDVNYPVSFALTRDLISSRNMAILDVYETEKGYKEKKGTDYISYMLKDYNQKEPYKFLEMLKSKDFKLPQIKEDVYYYLPYRMMDIFPTVSAFSTIDLKSGVSANHIFISLQGFKQVGTNIIFQNGIKIIGDKNLLQIGNQLIPIKSFIQVFYDKNRKIHKIEQKARPQGVNVVFMKSYGKWLIMDDFYLNSAYIQLFVFENSAGLFEPVIMTPLVKVYKVKK